MDKFPIDLERTPRCNFADLDAKRYGTCSVTLPIYRADVPEQTYTLKLHASYHPWIESFEVLLPFYVCALIFVIVCVIKIITTTHKIYHQQQILEQNRRDFTNAIAHELKNPLNVIRGFSENLLENTNEEKKDYYLEHIIFQTEEMDGLVQEMIQVSKLDSDQLKLEKEPLSLLEICTEQAKKFQTQIDEQQLKLVSSSNDDFRIQGDKIWLEKAIWNLMSNAVSYNCLQGNIIITANENQFTIENTGNHISQEDLPHIFEMLYTSDKSRTNNEKSQKHLGMGLYLAKKIFELHDLEISIENTLTGVCVTISNR